MMRKDAASREGNCYGKYSELYFIVVRIIFGCTYVKSTERTPFQPWAGQEVSSAIARRTASCSKVFPRSFSPVNTLVTR